MFLCETLHSLHIPSWNDSLGPAQQRQGMELCGRFSLSTWDADSRKTPAKCWAGNRKVERTWDFFGLLWTFFVCCSVVHWFFYWTFRYLSTNFLSLLRFWIRVFFCNDWDSNKNNIKSTGIIACTCVRKTFLLPYFKNGYQSQSFKVSHPVNDSTQQAGRWFRFCPIFGVWVILKNKKQWWIFMRVLRARDRVLGTASPETMARRYQPWHPCWSSEPPGRL